MVGMSPRFVILALAPLFAAAPAQAQAPGEWTPAAGPSTVQPVAAPVVPAGPRFPQKWSIGLSLGGTEITPEAAPDQAAQFGTAQLAVRYRVGRQLELELSFHGGRQQLEDGTDGELAMAGGTLAARYRFRVEHSWNWWVMAGLGATTIARHDATDVELEQAQRGHGTLGIGLEHRWTQFALQAEARATALGQSEAERMYGGEEMGLTAGTFTVGASYYF